MKPYVKPEIRYENFTLSESIATACNTSDGWVLRGSADLVNCYVETNQFGDETISAFASGTAGCSDHKEVEADCHTVLSGLSTVLTNSY